MVLLCGVLCGPSVLASEPQVQATTTEEQPTEGAELDVVGLIFDHIGDSYSWHIATIGGRHVEIPLLCIVRLPRASGTPFHRPKWRTDTPTRAFSSTTKGRSGRVNLWGAMARANSTAR